MERNSYDVEYCRTIFRFISAVVLGYTIYYIHYVMKCPSYANPRTEYGGFYRYLTYQNLYLLYLSNLLLLAGDQFIGHILLHGLVFPGTIVICLSYWYFFVFDRELVHPKGKDKYYPRWLNLIVHAGIIPIAFCNIIGTGFIPVPEISYFLCLLWPGHTYVLYRHIKTVTGEHVYAIFQHFKLYKLCLAAVPFMFICQYTGAYLSNIKL